MAKQISAGTKISIAKTYGTSANMTAVTNATEAVATLAGGHGLVVGDIIEVTSGWDGLNSKVCRVKTVATNDVTLEGIDTSDTNVYSAGSGTGSVRKITAWDDITQIAAVSFSVPSVEFADGSDLSSRYKKRIPTGYTLPDATITVHFDGTLPWVPSVRTATNKATPYAIRLTSSGGSKIYANAYWIYAEFPQIGSATETTKVQITLTFDSLPVGYAS